MIFKTIVIMIVTITLADANSFKEFKTTCESVDIQTGYSQNKDIAKAINEATLEAGKSLVRVFNGSEITGLTETKLIDIMINDNVDLKEEIRDYSSEKFSGNIFYQRVKAYSNGTKEYIVDKKGVVQVSAKLTCSHQMYKAIQDEILAEVLSSEKICVISKDDDIFSDIAIDEINEYLLSNQKSIRLYRCDTNDRDKLKNDDFTKIFIIDRLENEKFESDMGYELMTTLTTSFENLMTKELYGKITLDESHITQYNDEKTIDLLYRENIETLIKENIRRLLLQVSNKGR